MIIKKILLILGESETFYFMFLIGAKVYRVDYEKNR